MGLHLLTIEAAAAELGVPCKSLRTAAEADGITGLDAIPHLDSPVIDGLRLRLGRPGPHLELPQARRQGIRWHRGDDSARRSDCR